MGNVRYVVLSDLHLGVSYSLLTDLDQEGRVDPLQASATLRGLADGLRTLLLEVGGEEPPTLVLLGDIFDLSFAPARTAMMVFQRLIDEFFRPGQELFGPTILYVPGNHDHREWRVMRDAMFLDEVRGRHETSDGAKVPSPLPEQPAVTELFGARVDCQLATALMQNTTGSTDYSVEAAYPNFAYASGDRCVVFHHGHFVEPMYRAMSTVLEAVTGGTEITDVGELERINGPWIDFFWSSFGDQGDVVAEEAFSLYEAMLDAGATHDLVKKTAALMLDRFGGAMHVSAESTIGTHGVSLKLGSVVEALLDLTFGRAAQSERMNHGHVLSPGMVDGLGWYMAGPVTEQLDNVDWAEECGEVPSRFSFIFGHTHKPFQDQLLIPGFEHAVELWNTGGWVVDHPTMSPVQGGSVVLVDDDAHVAALRLYNDPLNGEIAHPRAAGTGGPQDQDNPLLAALTQALASDPTMFADFTSACGSGIDRRAAALRARWFDPTDNPDVDLRLRRDQAKSEASMEEPQR